MTEPTELHLPGFESPEETGDVLLSAQDEQVVSETVQPKASRPVAFGGFVKPEMYDVFGDYDLSSVTPAEREWMQPETLGAILFESDRRAKFNVDGICLNATEHSLVARHPLRLIEHAEEQSLKDKDIDDEVLATAARSQIHALESKSTSMAAHRDKLVEQRAMVDELGRQAKKPGYAHLPEKRMKELTSAAWLEFLNILDVVHVQRGWDDEARTRAEAALIHYLTQGSQRTRVQHWQSMIELASGYLGARTHLFGVRIRTVQSLLEAKNADYAERFV